ncbi:MAG: MBL fold metallo-hydrolase [Patescibacteria group bacterium]|nr:MBL fold metallo-hydrolase [Patescibacteria group bacterium]
MKEITMHTLGYHDMFSARYGVAENLTVLEVNGKTIVIEAPAQIAATLPRMKTLRSESELTHVDALIITHIDADHVAGFDSLIWHKVFGENSKLLLITHPEIAKQLWQRVRTAFEIDRIDMKTERQLEDYVNLIELKLGETIKVPQFGIEMETFHRSTHHAPFLSIAFRVFVDRMPILGYSGDTSFDSELIEFLAKGESYPIIHEAGSYTVGNQAHTHIEELLTLPVKIQKRLYLNHIPFVFEEKILQRIKEASSPIQIANALNDITI